MAKKADLRSANETKTIGELLSGFFAKGVSAPSVKLAQVQKAWEEIFGKGVGSRALQLRGTTLWVEIDSSARLQEMRNFQEPEILRRLNEKLSKVLITKIRYRFADSREETLHG